MYKRQGKRTVKARGCRRKGSPLAAAAQLLVYSDMTLFEYRDYFTLNEAESLQQLSLIHIYRQRPPAAALLRPALASGPAGQWVRLRPPRLGCEKEELNVHA